MTKNKLQLIGGCLAVIAFFSVGLMLYPSIVFSGAFYIVCAYVVIDAFVLIVGYSMLRKLNMLVSWRFAVYLAVIIGGNLAINFLLFTAAYKSILFFALVIFILIAFLNFVLSKTIFALSIREAYLIGVLMGLINTLMSIMTTPSVCK
jgi:hypothetical protein